MHKKKKADDGKVTNTYRIVPLMMNAALQVRMYETITPRNICGICIHMYEIFILRINSETTETY